MFGLKRLTILAGVAVLLPAIAGAQAMVEYGAGVARGGVSGAAAGSRVGSSTGAVFNKAGQTMNRAARPARGNSKYPVVLPDDPKVTARPPEPTPPPEVANNPVVDPAEIKEGLARQEVVDKFGKPSMKITMMDGPDVVERMLYRAHGRDTVLVIIRNGRVASAQALAN